MNILENPSKSITTPVHQEKAHVTPHIPQNLLHPEKVLEKYPKLLNLSNVGRLSVKLAIEAYFGIELMKKSTVYGCSDKPSLPKDRVDQLKKKLVSIHFRATPIEFEPYWKLCADAINHACSTLRAKSITTPIEINK